MLLFHAQILTIHPPGQKTKQNKTKEGFSFQCFSWLCVSFCAGRVDVNRNMRVCCVCHSLMCPIYTHIVIHSE